MAGDASLEGALTMRLTFLNGFGEWLCKYVTFLEENSFDFDYPSLVAAYHNRFYFGGNLIDVNISIPDMEAFLLEQELIFEKLALEHIKKIKQYNNLKIKEK